MNSAGETRPVDDLHEVREALRVVDVVYAAACGETGWDRVIAETCRFGQLDACVLSSVDPLGRRRVDLASRGLDGETGTGCTVPLPALLTAEVQRSGPGAVWQDHQIMSAPLFATTPFWTDWMQPRGFVSWACVVVGRDEGRVSCLEVLTRPRRASAGPPVTAFLRLLAPHLSRAWRLGGASRSTQQPPAAPSGDRSAVPAAERGDPDRASMSDVAALRAAFRLTKAEARLALRLADGASLTAAAEAFDVKLTTIRSQLQQVFAKTGTSRQAELVALLLNRRHAARSPMREPAGPDPSEAAAGDGRQASVRPDRRR